MRVAKGRLGFFREERGFTLAEVLIAVAILAVIAVVFLSALSTTAKSVDLYQQRVTAQSLLQSQLENIKAATYDPGAPSDPNGAYSGVAITPTSGYDITTSAVKLSDGKQEVTVTVSRGEHHLLELTIIKADWQ